MMAWSKRGTETLTQLLLCNTLLPRCHRQLIIWSDRLGLCHTGTLTTCLAQRHLPTVCIVTQHVVLMDEFNQNPKRLTSAICGENVEKIMWTGMQTRR